MPKFPKFSPRGIAKYMTNALLVSTVEVYTVDAIADHTSFDEDDRIVRIAGGVVGGAVGDLSKPYTDHAVDFVSDKIVAVVENSKKDDDTTPPEKS